MPKLRKPNASHYIGDVEPIDLIVSLGLGPAYCRGNIIKYVSRYDRKGEAMKDLRKAQQYLEWLVELEEENVRREEERTGTPSNLD